MRLFERLSYVEDMKLFIFYKNSQPFRLGCVLEEQYNDAKIT